MKKPFITTVRISIIFLLQLLSGQAKTARRIPSKTKPLAIKIKIPNYDQIYKALEPLLLENPLIQEHKKMIIEHKKELKKATKDHKKKLKQQITLLKSTLKKFQQNTLAETIHDIKNHANKSNTKEEFDRYKKHFDEIKKLYTKTSAWKILETLKLPKHLQKKS